MDRWVAIDDGPRPSRTTPSSATARAARSSAGPARSTGPACPSFDSPAFFARILGEPGGFWSIRPPGPAEATREYVEDTMVLETAVPHRVGHRACSPTSCRCIRTTATTTSACTRPPGSSGSSSAPRAASSSTSRSRSDPEFGLTTPLVRADRARERGARAAVRSRSRCRPMHALEIDGAVLRAALALDAGERTRVRAADRRSWGDAPPAHTPGGDPRARATPRSRAGSRGPRSSSATKVRTGRCCGAVRSCCGRSTTRRPARSSPRPPRRCPRRSAGSATGTTATRGCATRASRSARSRRAAAASRRRRFFDFFANATAGQPGQRAGPADHVRRAG